MQQPLVTICIPTFNGMAYLESALASALNQSYNNIEVLICDDGSTDGTVAFTKRQTDKRIRFIQHAKKESMVTNWNYCLQQARGTWIKLLFQDDLLHPDCVQRMLDAGLSNQADIVLCSREFMISEKVNPRVKAFFNSAIKPEHLFGDKEIYVSPIHIATKAKCYLLQNVLGEPSCYLFKKKILDEVGYFNNKMTQFVDYEFILRTGLRYGFVFLPDALVSFNVHEYSQSSVNSKNDKFDMQVVKATTGDSMILLNEYLTHPDFSLIRNMVGKECLETYLRHIYFSGCKHYGKTYVNKALNDLDINYQTLGLTYTFLKYVYYRWKIKHYILSAA